MLIDSLEPKLTYEQRVFDLFLRMGIVKERKGRQEGPDTQRACLEMGKKGRGMEGKEEGSKGRQFQIHLPHKVTEVHPDPGHSQRLPAAAPTFITEM